jgi:hypothetical protein
MPPPSELTKQVCADLLADLDAAPAVDYLKAVLWTVAEHGQQEGVP